MEYVDTCFGVGYEDVVSAQDGETEVRIQKCQGCNSYVVQQNP